MEAHLAHNQENAGSIPVSAIQRLKGKRKNKRKEYFMTKKLDIIENQIKLGQVKTITSNGGTFIDFVQLLFSPTTKAQFAPSDNLKEIIFSVTDNNLDLPQLECNMSKDTLRDLIISLKTVYNELEDENK